MTGQTKELILKYFDSFLNLYGIISMRKALEIIRQQNPKHSITDDEFRSFIDSIDFDDKYYIIVYDDEMYGGKPSDDSDSLNKYLIAEFLYAADKYAYNEMKETQEGLEFYVPDCDELLQYSDEFYIEKNNYHTKMKSFLAYELHLDTSKADDIIEDWICCWHAETIDNVDNEINFAIDRLRILTNDKFIDFESLDQSKRFSILFADMYNNTRMTMYRGLTPIEACREAECKVYKN